MFWYHFIYSEYFTSNTTFINKINGSISYAYHYCLFSIFFSLSSIIKMLVPVMVLLKVLLSWSKRIILLSIQDVCWGLGTFSKNIYRSIFLVIEQRSPIMGCYKTRNFVVVTETKKKIMYIFHSNSSTIILRIFLGHNVWFRFSIYDRIHIEWIHIIINKNK